MDCSHYYPKEFHLYSEYVNYLKAKEFAVDAPPPMNKEYINPSGQRVVDVEIGYKVYDSKHKDSVILRVGDNRNGSYMYKDMQPVADNTDEICFMSEKILMHYEKILKCFTSDQSFTEEQQLHKIIELNKGCGLKGTDINEICKSNGKDPIEFFNDFFGQIPE